MGLRVPPTRPALDEFATRARSRRQVRVAEDLGQSDGDLLGVDALDVWPGQVALLAEERGHLALAHGLQRHLHRPALRAAAEEVPLELGILRHRARGRRVRGVDATDGE